MNKIFSVNFQIPFFEDDYIPFESNMLLSDADVILIKPEHNTKYYKSSYHWKEEIDHVLELGKTVIVILTQNHHECYKFLPTLPVEIISATNIEVFAKSQIAQPIHNLLRENWLVQSYLKVGIEAEILFSSKNNDRVLGASFKVNNGHILLIPEFNFDNSKLILRNMEGWTDFGKKTGKTFKQHLSDIHNSLNAKEEISAKPDWADRNEFEIEAANNILEKIGNNLNVIERLQIENEQLHALVKEKELLKNLLFETGKGLEKAVIKALNILGYTAENYDDGVLELDQVIISPEGDRFIGECEGKDNKAIDITKFRQLQDNLNEDFQREEVTDKAFGLLFGNPQRLISPYEREFDFTDKCKKGAVREGVGLINTVDLFNAARYLSENPDEIYKFNCRSAIKEQLGQVIKFPEMINQPL